MSEPFSREDREAYMALVAEKRPEPRSDLAALIADAETLSGKLHRKRQQPLRDLLLRMSLALVAQARHIAQLEKEKAEKPRIVLPS